MKRLLTLLLMLAAMTAMADNIEDIHQALLAASDSQV